MAKTYQEANNTTTMTVKEGINLTASSGEKITLYPNGKGPGEDDLTYKWWHYSEADTYEKSKVQKNERVYNKVKVLVSVLLVN